ncbi:fibronectin type III domain-containing protein, partial [Flavobacterium silvaticum]
MKKITLYLVMLLMGFSGFSQVETFDEPGVVAPAGLGPWLLPATGTWQILDNGVGTTVNWGLNPQDVYPAHSGTQCAYMNRMNVGAGNTSEDYLVTPLLSTPQDAQFRFFTRTTIAGQSTPNSTLYQIRSAPATADPTQYTSFTTIVAQWTENELTDNFDVWEEKVINITDPVGTQMYYAFVRVFTQPTPAPNGDRWLVDDFKFISKCLDVTNLTAACLSTSTVLSWQSPGAATQWAVQVLPAGQEFDPNAGTPIIATTNTNFTVTQTTQPTVGDLVPLTDYVFYVQALCPDSGSEWVQVECTTQAAPPECGGNYVDSGGVDNEYSNNESVTTTICPETPGDQVTVTFTMFNTENTWDGIYVFDGNSVNAPMIPSDLGSGNGPMDTPGGYWGTEIPGPFTSSSPDGCLTFLFVSDGSGTRDGFESDVTCGPPPPCPKPGLLTAVTVNPTDATVSWANNGPGTAWQVLVLPANAPAPTETSVGVSATSAYTIPDLTSSTCYDVYVRADCSSTDNGLSAWAGPLEICTPALPPECGGNYIDVGGVDGPYLPGMNEITTICPETPGDVVTVHFTFMETEDGWDGFYVFNGNGIDDPMIPSTNGAGFNFNLQTPGAYWGTTIPDDFQSTSPDGCLTFQFISDGIFEEGGFNSTITCGPPPPCPKPTAITINSTTSFGAVITFTDNSTATSWDIYAVACGSPAPAADATPTVSGATTTQNVPVPGLEPDTCYDFYVRANCTNSDNGFSDWSGPRSATTQVAPPVCGGQYIDLGGANGTYPANLNSIVTVCPETPGEIVTVTFTSFETDPQADGLYVYDGNSTASPLIASNNPAGFGLLTQPGAWWGTQTLPIFESSSPDGCLTFQFISDGFFGLDGFIADVTCGPPPACPKPTQLQATNFTVNSAELSWTNNGPATAWQVIAVPCGSPIPAADDPNWVDADTNPYTLEGLASSSCFDFYVRSDCGDEDGVSNPAGPREGETLVAPPECGGIFVDNGGSDSYEASSDYFVTVCPEAGEVVTVTFTSFNTENNFDALYVFDGPTTASPQILSGNGAGAVPGGLAGGFWGGNIPGPFQSTSPDGCLTFMFRSDTSVQLDGWVANVTCSACPIPLNLVAVQPYTFGADLSWNTVPGATYDVYVVPAGSPAPDASTTPTFSGVPASPMPFHIPGDPLTQLTDYDFYVRAVCPDGIEESPWNGPASFTTLPTCPQPVNITSATTTGTATIQWTEVGPATQWEVWVVPSGSAVPIPGTGNIVVMDPAVNPITYNTLEDYGVLIPGLYDFYVHSICSDTDSSLITGPHEFYILNADPICAEVTPANPDINADGVINLCPGESCVDLTATYVDNHSTEVYAIESIPFAPPFPFDGGIELNISTDDIWGPVFELPFNFCFFGVNYTSVKVGSNGVVTFNNNNDTFCPWNTNPGTDVPNPNFPILNAIYGVYQDINPAVDTPVTHTINYQVLGTAPCRVFVINYVNIAQFQCELDSPLQTSQIVLYETSNNIEVYVKDRVSCTSWNEGAGVIGIQNPDGSAGYTPPGRNLGTWEAHDEAWRFKPDGESLVTFSWLMGDEFYSSDTTINVCVSELTTMTAQAVYNGCGGVITTKTAEVILSPQVIDVEPIEDVTQCDPYTLPAIVGAGNYFTGPDGTGDPHFAGDIISATTPMYVYAFITANGETCSDQEMFTITIGGQTITTPGDQTVCDEYILPELTNGSYYGQADGAGDVIPVATPITETATIWVYAPSDVGCPAQGSFVVTVNHTPVLVDPAVDIIQCTPYTFPTPTVGHYYDGPGGTGNILDGTTVSAPADALPVYLYGAAIAPCVPAETAFTITIHNGAVADDLPDANANCSFELPVLSAGNFYWTLPGGTGTQLFAGGIISTTQDIFVYVPATEDCPSSETFFTVTVTPAPVLDAVGDLSDCESITLPSLSVGSYYTDAEHT